MPRKEFNVKINKKRKINSNPLISKTFFVFQKKKKNAREK